MKDMASMGFLPSGWSCSTTMKLRSAHLIMSGEDDLPSRPAASHRMSVTRRTRAFRMMQVLPKNSYFGFGKP